MFSYGSEQTVEKLRKEEIGGDGERGKEGWWGEKKRKGKAVAVGICVVFSLQVLAKINRFTCARARQAGTEPACHEAQVLILGRWQSFKDSCKRVSEKDVGKTPELHGTAIEKTDENQAGVWSEAKTKLTRP